MELRQAIRTTGAVRQFTDDAVPRSTVVEILDDARFAASGGNRQPWRVAVVEDPGLRRELAALMHPVWDEYVAFERTDVAPYNVVDYERPAHVAPGRPNPLLDEIDRVPVVLAVAADLARIATMDADLDRPPITGGGSVYPFCWNLLLSARAHGLGGVMTTFSSRVEAAVGPALGLPPHHALAATIFLGVPRHQPTKLRRRAVPEFTTLDRFDGRPVPGAPAG